MIVVIWTCYDLLPATDHFSKAESDLQMRAWPVAQLVLEPKTDCWRNELTRLVPQNKWLRLADYCETWFGFGVARSGGRKKANFSDVMVADTARVTVKKISLYHAFFGRFTQFKLADVTSLALFINVISSPGGIFTDEPMVFSDFQLPVLRSAFPDLCEKKNSGVVKAPPAIGRC